MARACTDPSCTGTFVDGFCDTCGRAEPPAATAAPATTPATATAKQGGYSRTGRITGARRPVAAVGTVGTVPGSGASRTNRGTRGSSSRRRALGGGLVQMPVEPSLDPLKLLMADPRVPDGKAVCPTCGNRVNPDKRFCSNCGSEYNFRPSLQAGQVLAGQYEVKGPIAFGGLGWIYLAMDTHLNRWVVLKGLLNARDEAAAAVAVAERQFLAAVKHGKIVGIYTFLTHGGESFIVMEYVNGRTLKAIRRERGPLPAAEAMAYIIGILPAFAYLHDHGLVYCDFKPDNVMAEGDDVKLIDMGAVRRIGDPHGDIYGTLGFKAPEADSDPQAVSDLFTIGRTLATLIMDFDNTGRWRTDLPPPNDLLVTLPTPAQRATAADGGPLPAWLRWNAAARSFTGAAPPGISAVTVSVDGAPLTLTLPLAANESLYRFLLKATAASMDARFQSADEMAAQLSGVLRETVSRDGPVPAMDSAVFLPEPAGADPATWRCLPDLRLDPADPAAAALFAARNAAPDQLGAMLDGAIRLHPTSIEALLRRADAMIAAGPELDAVMRRLDIAKGLDAFDWRPDWYCGKLYLALGRPRDAIECFDTVFSEIPGEPAPKLALGLALEADGRHAEAATLYDTASRADPALTAAAFGLARCRATLRDRAGAVAALARIPDNAATSAAARLAAIRLLSDGEEADLRQAAALLATLPRDGIAANEAEAALALAAASRAEAGALREPTPLLGVPPTPRALRQRAEAALRACARLASSQLARITYVDRANAVRPRTWL